MQSAHGEGIPQPQRQELPAFGFAAIVVGLVGDDEGGDAGTAQPRCHRSIVVGEAYGGVDAEQHEVGPPHCLLHLAAHLGIEFGTAG